MTGIFKQADDGSTGWWLAHDRWVNAALAMAIVQMAVAPLIVEFLTPAQLLVFLHSPGYMLHQVEEHLDDRFRSFVNERMFGGVNAMTTRFIIWVNCVWVWGLNLLALLAAILFEPATGAGLVLVAPYAMLIDGIGHAAMAVRLKSYNPGLVSSLVVFLPLAVATLWAVPGTVAQHVFAIAAVVVLHGAILWNTRRRAAAIGATTA